MKLDQLMDEQEVSIDANILIYAWTRSSVQCGQLLERCAKGALKGSVPMHALLEASHRMMVGEARVSGLTAANPARFLSGKPEIVKSLTRHHALVRELISTGISVLIPQAEDLRSAFEIQSRYGLMTNDALFAAVTLRCGIPSIASADTDFKAVSGITLYTPADLA